MCSACSDVDPALRDFWEARKSIAERNARIATLEARIAVLEGRTLPARAGGRSLVPAVELGLREQSVLRALRAAPNGLQRTALLQGFTSEDGLTPEQQRTAVSNTVKSLAKVGWIRFENNRWMLTLDGQQVAATLR